MIFEWFSAVSSIGVRSVRLNRPPWKMEQEEVQGYVRKNRNSVKENVSIKEPSHCRSRLDPRSPETPPKIPEKIYWTAQAFLRSGYGRSRRYPARIIMAA